MKPPLALLALLALVAAGAASAAEEKVLNVFTWPDYIAPDTIRNFEREYGIKVNYDTYDSTEMAEARLLAGRTGYDVVVHAERYSARLIPIGVYQPLDKSKLPNLKYLDPWVMASVAQDDPGNRYGVPYLWGTTGFAYNERMIRERMPDAPVTSGDMIFKPEVVKRFADCGVSFLDEPTDVIPMAMLYLGHDPNSVDPGDLADVERLLKSVRPYIRYFSSAKMLIDLPNEEVCIAMSWSGRLRAGHDARQAGGQARAARLHHAEGGDAGVVRPLVHPRRRAASRQRPPVPQLPAAPRSRRADRRRDALRDAEPRGDQAGAARDPQRPGRVSAGFGAASRSTRASSTTRSASAAARGVWSRVKTGL